MTDHRGRGQGQEYCQKVLKERLEVEGHVWELLSKINHSESQANALYDLAVAIPCILQFEMRVGIKMIIVLIMRGMECSDQAAHY